MELKETIDMMVSDDYKERFKAEYSQLKTRTEKLESMLEKWKYGALDFEPNCPSELLKKQLNAMHCYQSCLEERAKIEEIELGE